MHTASTHWIAATCTAAVVVVSCLALARWQGPHAEEAPVDRVLTSANAIGVVRANACGINGAVVTLSDSVPGTASQLAALRGCGGWHRQAPSGQEDFALIIWMSNKSRLTPSRTLRYSSSTGELWEGDVVCRVPVGFRDWMLDLKSRTVVTPFATEVVDRPAGIRQRVHVTAKRSLCHVLSVRDSRKLTGDLLTDHHVYEIWGKVVSPDTEDEMEEDYSHLVGIVSDGQLTVKYAPRSAGRRVCYWTREKLGGGQCGPWNDPVIVTIPR